MQNHGISHIPPLAPEAKASPLRKSHWSQYRILVGYQAMKRLGPFGFKHLLILALIAASVPLHLAVKRMVWYEQRILLTFGVQAPDFNLQDEKGRKFSLREQRGKAVMLCFCSVDEPACAAQAQGLNILTRNYADKGLEIFFLAKNDSIEEMIKFEKVRDAEFYMLRDRGGKVAKRYKIGSQPTNYVIDRSGKIVNAFGGRVRANSHNIRKAIDYALGAGQ
jgi:peroxiredoxin